VWEIGHCSLRSLADARHRVLAQAGGEDGAIVSIIPDMDVAVGMCSHWTTRLLILLIQNHLCILRTNAFRCGLRPFGFILVCCIDPFDRYAFMFSKLQLDSCLFFFFFFCININVLLT
ncbi:hypothetical protein BHE74_00003377, partial [Ensete ventricosum]